ncbi:hypothetical protein [Maritalea porphyrae]|uniref:Peptidase inhibitor family I36 n=1 Tax=Maritalea porphyrae TaxID=880732 RepID=A0ABQ5UV23_9HYPH|nr:hypothetical protein [Maritalea porphyrae]GLQ17827.1 hypothetical protein GCM10007879_20760 [Maritalea porphyrae]
MNKNLTAKLVLAASLLLVPNAAFSATFELKAPSASERGWSAKADCESKAGGACASAYFCSNNIWMAATAFDRVQDRRYAGEQLIIVRDGQPICAVN